MCSRGLEVNSCLFLVFVSWVASMSILAVFIQCVTCCPFVISFPLQLRVLILMPFANDSLSLQCCVPRVAVLVPVVVSVVL